MPGKRTSPVTWLMPLGTLVQFMLPRWLLVPVARLGGALFCRFDRRRRRGIEENLRHTVGPDVPATRLRALTRRTFANLAVGYLDLLRSPVMRQRMTSLVEVSGLSHLDRVLSRGRGAILVTAHIGNWDLAGVVLSALGYPLSAVVEPVPAGWGRTFNRYRSITNLETIPIPDRAGMVRAVRRRRVFTLVGDRDIGGRGVLVPSFDAQRRFPRGAAAYSLKYGVPIVTGFLLLNPGPGRPYIGFIEPPVEFHPGGDTSSDIERLTAVLAERINRVIARYPDQWLVFRAGWV